MVLGGVGYLIYKKEYIPLMSPPKEPPSHTPEQRPSAQTTKQGAGARPVARPAHHMVPHHHAKHKPGLSHDKLLAEFEKRAAEREKIFSKFGAKKKGSDKVMEKIASRPKRTRRLHLKTHGAKETGPKTTPRPPSQVDNLSRVIGKDYVDRLDDLSVGLSKKEGDYFSQLSDIIEKKQMPLKEEHVKKLAKVSKEIHKTGIKPQDVKEAFESSDIDRLGSFLESRKKAKTFVKETKNAQKVTDDFDKLSQIVETKPKDFDAFEELSHGKREDLFSDLEVLGSEKTRKTAVEKMSDLAGAQSKTDLLKTFKKMSLERHVDKDVFSILLDYLLKSGKITKSDVHDILHHLEQEGALTKEEVADVLFRIR